MRTADNGWSFSDDLWFEYWGKSDAQLQNIMNTASTKLLTETLPGNIGYSEQRDLKAQVAAASSVLKKRKEHAERMKSIIETRKQKQKESYRNLRVAFTFNAQLVAAILEDEDGKTIEELNGWCDELSVIERSEFRQLLSDMVIDGVIEKKGDKYFLERLCEEDLLFSDEDRFKDWIIKRCRNKQIQKSETEDWVSGGIQYERYRALAEIIYWETFSTFMTEISRFVFYPEDLIKRICEHNDFVKDYNENTWKPDDENSVRLWDIKLSGVLGFEKMLDAMVQAGALKKSVEGWFYVPMLGEK